MDNHDDLYHGASIEVYGFVSWILTFVLFLMYLVWAFAPDELLHLWGITYYPNKYWAVAIPTWITLTFFTAIFLYYALSLYLGAADFDSTETITDSHAIPMPQSDSNTSPEALPQMYDLDLHYVNQMLYN